MSTEEEVAALRLMLREVAQTNATGIDYALVCQRERDEARAERDEAHASWLLWQGKYGDAKRESNELRMGRDAARAEAEEAARAYNDVAADLRRTAAERDELAAQAVDRLMLVASLRSELATTKRELHRLIHGTAIEGDGACEHEIHADAARAWSRLWHREARRLWREVQALSKELDVIGWRVRYEWRPEISCPWSEARSDLLSFPDARATASNLRQDPRTYAVRVVRVYRRRRPT